MALVRVDGHIQTVRGPHAGASWRVRQASGRLAMPRARQGRATPAQVAYRQRFRAATRAWDALSDAERVAWNDWADAYGTAADPKAVPTISGRGRFVGAHTLRAQVGLAPITTPSSSGIGNADAALVMLFPSETAATATVEMRAEYPTPTVSPATAALYAGPRQPLSRSSNSRRTTLIDSFDVTGGGPGFDGGPISVDLPEIVGRGSMLWVRARVVTGAGNTSSVAEWPIYQPGLDQLRAFRMGPLFDFLSPQHFEIVGTDLVMRFEVGTVSEFEIVYDLTAKATNTLQKLADQIDSDGLWRVWDRNADVASEASTVLDPRPITPVTTGQQPALLTLPET